MKKLTMTLAAMMAVTAAVPFTGITASAKANNIVSISYDTVQDEIVTAAGSVIPAGATAISINLENSADFVASEYKLNVEGADMLVGANGDVIVEVGEVSGTAVYYAVQTDDVVFITGVALPGETQDGTVLTLYAANMPSAVSVADADFYANFNAVERKMDSMGTVKTAQVSPYALPDIYYTIVGDANNDGIVDLADAALALNAITIGEQYGITADDSILGKFIYNQVFQICIQDLLPGVQYINGRRVVCSLTLDGNDDGAIANSPDHEEKSDVYQILKYYGDTTSQLEYNEPGWDIGKNRFVSSDEFTYE